MKYLLRLILSSSMKNNPDPGLDETPIGPKFKSFEEMLEEKLVLDNDEQRTPEPKFASNPKSGSNSPKPFLRRGSGILAQRYGGISTPNLRRSKSQVVKKPNANAGDKQPNMKTSTSCPNVGNQAKITMRTKKTLQLKPMSGSKSKPQISQVR